MKRTAQSKFNLVQFSSVYFVRSVRVLMATSFVAPMKLLDVEPG